MRTFVRTVICVLTMLVTVGAQAKDVICRVELEREILPAGKEQTAIIKVLLDAPEAPKDGERPPVNLAIVLDRSGSMSGAKIEKAKEAAIAALRRLGSRDLFSLVMYDHRVETIVPVQSAANTEWIEGRIRSIQPGGNTALFGGVSQGAAEVRKHIEDEKYTHRIILLSDGLANVGPSSPADLARLGAALIKEGISVSTVGVGTDYNEDLMTQLSQRSDGNSYFVESSKDLPKIFAAELGDVLSVVARKVIIEIECPNGARPIRIIGRDGRIEDNKVSLYLNQLYGGQEKFALVEVSVPATEAETSREIAVARCSYEDALTQKDASSSGRASVRFSQDEKEVIESVNKDVQADYNCNQMAIVRDEAIALADKGEKEAAVQLMLKNSADLRQLSQDYNNGSLAAQSEELRRDAEELQQRGMDKSLRKDYRARNYQIYNQQQVEQ